MLKKKVNSYNDGVIGIYKEKSTLTNDFNAKTNAKTIDDYDFIMNLFYSEQSKRQEDFLFANAMGSKLTLKLKTPLVENIKTSYKVILNNFVYDIISIDPDKTNKELYFYLEGGRELEEQNQREINGN